MQIVDFNAAENPGPTQEMRGTVKWFNAVKGFGFVTPPGDQQTPAARAALRKSEADKWWPILKAAGIKPD